LVVPWFFSSLQNTLCPCDFWRSFSNFFSTVSFPPLKYFPALVCPAGPAWWLWEIFPGFSAGRSFFFSCRVYDVPLFFFFVFTPFFYEGQVCAIGPLFGAFCRSFSPILVGKFYVSSFFNRFCVAAFSAAARTPPSTRSLRSPPCARCFSAFLFACCSFEWILFNPPRVVAFFLPTAFSFH